MNIYESKITYTRAICVALLLAVIIIINNPQYKTHAYKYYSSRKSSISNKYARHVLDLRIPISYVKPKILAAKVNQIAPWARLQIATDFSHFADNVWSQENVLATFNSLPAENLVVMFTINNGHVSIRRPDIKMNQACEHGLEVYNNIFMYLAKHWYINNVSFLLRLSDYFPNISEQQAENIAPILTTSKDLAKKIEQDLILIPDYMSLEDIPKLAPRILQANKTFPWVKKNNLILWRGGHADISGFRKEIVKYSQTHPQSIIDAKFTKGKHAFMLPEFQVQSKFLLNIDGHTAAWTRPIWQLLSNSVMLKQNSTLTQWYYAALEPGKHFIPVPNDPYELEKNLALYTDDQLQEIAQHGSVFAANNLMFDDMLAYLVETLNQYKIKQDNAVPALINEHHD